MAVKLPSSDILCELQENKVLFYQNHVSIVHCVLILSAILVIEFVYAIVGIVWLTQYYSSCNDVTAKSVTLGTYLKVSA